MGVALNAELLGHFDAACLGHTSHVVPPEIDKHQVFGDFLGIVL